MATLPQGMWPRRLAAIFIGYFCSLAIGWLWLAGVEAHPLVKFGALLVCGALSGATASRFAHFAGQRAAFAWSAFAAVLTLWMPVVATTYGFALVATPLLALYGIAVAAGWRFAGRLR